MTNRGYYPPSHRRTDVPQPEVDEVTGFVVYGHELVVSEARGLAGRRVGAASKFLAHARNTPAEWQREIDVPDLIGQGRVYEPGDEKWFAPAFPQEWSTPQDLDDLALWLRNDDIPYSGLVPLWNTPGGLGLSPARQTTAALQPIVESDPFSTDYRGLLFGGLRLMTLDIALPLTGAFTYMVAFRTPAALLETELLAGTTARVRITATGALQVVNDAGLAGTAANAASITTSTSYVVTIIRASDNTLSARVNGVDVSAADTRSGTLTITKVGDTTGGGMALALAEHSLHTADHEADNRLPALERTLARYVGVTI